MSDAGDPQRRVDALLEASDSEGTGADRFSPFDWKASQRAGDLAGEMRRAAQQQGLGAALATAEKAAESEPASLVKQAVKVFVTHEPLAREHLALPVIEALETDRGDGQMKPSRPPPGGMLPPGIPGAPPRADAETGTPGLEAAPPPDAPDDWDAQTEPSLTEPVPERALDWYREDPFANDHHAHWHLVYHNGGHGQAGVQRRHGELFFYMHEQMLARYDTERVIAGLERVKAHPSYDAERRPDYAQTILEGYGSRGYTLRRAGRSFSELADAVADSGALHRRLAQAIEEDRLDLDDGVDHGHLTESQLGSATEPAALRTDAGVIDISRIAARFGNLHGSGHMHASALGEGPDPLLWGGVMGWTETAICDPFFYRWHKHVDDLNADFQDRSGETNDPATHAPPGVSFGDGPSVALCLSRDIPDSTSPSFDFDRFARERLGPDLDGADELLTSQLLTRFVRSRVTAGLPRGEVPWPDQVSYWTTHLTHEPFTYFVRLKNTAADPRDVTIRTFLAHAELAEDRRAWIELDKFEASVDPGISVLARPDARSSVIKRRGVTAPGAEELEAGAEDVWCDCGWPYSLLLPSGASDTAGTPFKLMIALTDYQQDLEPDHVRTCGSMSYCGARENYPDRRRMGYPFDRPFAGQSVSEAIAATPSMTSIDLMIRCENKRPPE